MSNQVPDRNEANDDDWAPAAPSHSRTLARLVRGKNINETSLLATDYLNHFNEIIILIELIPSMPDCLDEAKAWRPKSYSQHFQDSCFSDKELAVLAYENSPPRFREPFDSAVATLDALIIQGLEKIDAVVDNGNEELLADTAANLSHTLRQFVDVASAIINGDEMTVDQAKIDQIING